MRLEPKTGHAWRPGRRIVLVAAFGALALATGCNYVKAARQEESTRSGCPLTSVTAHRSCGDDYAYSLVTNGCTGEAIFYACEFMLEDLVIDCSRAVPACAIPARPASVLRPAASPSSR